jgi:hypothetical protein
MMCHRLITAAVLDLRSNFASDVSNLKRLHQLLATVCALATSLRRARAEVFRLILILSFHPTKEVADKRMKVAHLTLSALCIAQLCRNSQSLQHCCSLHSMSHALALLLRYC